jgi:hypothetical protein
LNSWVFVGVALVILGGLEVSGIFAFLPQCGFGFNFGFVSGCLYPITIFGLNPNLLAGIALIVGGIAVIAVASKKSEAES